jgi:hypothetical protein
MNIEKTYNALSASNKQKVINFLELRESKDVIFAQLKIFTSGLYTSKRKIKVLLLKKEQGLVICTFKDIADFTGTSKRMVNYYYKKLQNTMLNLHQKTLKDCESSY